MSKDEVFGHCDKCGQPVAAGNDAAMLTVAVGLIRKHGHGFAPEDIDRGALGFAFLSVGSRHLKPEGDCPGSPSRAQYLKGQPRDDRYPYLGSNEVEIRAAWAWLKAHDFSFYLPSDNTTDEG